MSIMKTVVLAYSGGLDTSVCIPLLKERYDYDKVITVVADVGQPASEIDDATRRAESLADEQYIINVLKQTDSVGVTCLEQRSCMLQQAIIVGKSRTVFNSRGMF